MAMQHPLGANAGHLHSSTIHTPHLATVEDAATLIGRYWVFLGAAVAQAPHKDVYIVMPTIKDACGVLWGCQ